MEVRAVLRLERYLTRWELLGCLHVSVYLIVDTALQLGTLSRQLLGVHGDILVARRARGDGDEARHPARAAQFATAWADATYPSGLLTSAYLLHLYPDTERLCQHLYELAEVHALVCYIVEDRLVAIALVLNIANLHVQAKGGGYLAGADHGGVLLGLGLLVLLEVIGARLTIDLFGLLVIAIVVLAHLEENQLAGEGNGADIVAWSGFDGDDITLLKREVGVVQVISLTRVLELYLNVVRCALGIGDACEPVVCIELGILYLTAALSAHARAAVL